LTGAFLPHLFEGLDLMDRDASGRPCFRDPAAASRAVHLLQYLVDGSTATPEPLLVLNKILCGILIATPVEPHIEATAREIELCDRLLKSMIANWKIIENTSVAGLRETFLRREGRLQRSTEGWRLTIPRKTVDVLIDYIPWSVAVVYHRWMLDPVLVSW